MNNSIKKIYENNDSIFLDRIARKINTNNDSVDESIDINYFDVQGSYKNTSSDKYSENFNITEYFNSDEQPHLNGGGFKINKIILQDDQVKYIIICLIGITIIIFIDSFTK